jgi:Rho termination factor, N-terminal domain
MKAISMRLVMLASGVALGALAGARLVVPRVRRRQRRGHLDDLTRDELYELARESDVEGRSGMTKDELIRALRDR